MSEQAISWRCFHCDGDYALLDTKTRCSRRLRFCASLTCWIALESPRQVSQGSIGGAGGGLAQGVNASHCAVWWNPLAIVKIKSNRPLNPLVIKRIDGPLEHGGVERAYAKSGFICARDHDAKFQSHQWGKVKSRLCMQKTLSWKSDDQRTVRYNAQNFVVTIIICLSRYRCRTFRIGDIPQQNRLAFCVHNEGKINIARKIGFFYGKQPASVSNHEREYIR